MGSGYEIRDGELVLRINPSVYSLDKVYATAYIFLDKFYFVFDGDKNSEIIVRVKPKVQGQDLDKFSDRFFEELLSISNYFNLFEKNKELLSLVLQRALFSVTPPPISPKEQEAIENIKL